MLAIAGLCLTPALSIGGGLWKYASAMDARLVEAEKHAAVSDERLASMDKKIDALLTGKVAENSSAIVRLQEAMLRLQTSKGAMQ